MEITKEQAIVLNELDIHLIVAGLRALKVLDKIIPDPNRERAQRQAEVVDGLIERLEKVEKEL